VGREEVQLSGRQLQISGREDSWVLKILILRQSSPKRKLPNPSFVFLDKISDKKKMF